VHEYHISTISTSARWQVSKPANVSCQQSANQQSAINSATSYLQNEQFRPKNKEISASNFIPKTSLDIFEYFSRQNQE
jgi:hypothetical protein